MQNSTKIIDDRAPSVLYSPGWRRGGNPNFEFDNTTTKANTPGLTATLNFTGIGIKVFGTIAEDGDGKTPKSSYAVDALPVQSFTGVQQSDIQYRVLFFQSRPLLPGNHTLIVTNTGKSNASLFLDYFEVDEGYSTPTLTTVTVSAVSWSSAVASVQSSNINVLEANSTPHILVVVTALLGGFLVLSLFSLAVFYFRRRRRAIAVGYETQPTENGQGGSCASTPSGPIFLFIFTFL